MGQTFLARFLRGWQVGASLPVQFSMSLRKQLLGMSHFLLSLSFYSPVDNISNMQFVWLTGHFPWHQSRKMGLAAHHLVLDWTVGLMNWCGGISSGKLEKAIIYLVYMILALEKFWDFSWNTFARLSWAVAFLFCSSRWETTRTLIVRLSFLW